MASAVVLGVLPTGSASAARGLETGFGEYFFESEDASERTLLFDSAREAGAGIVRLEASWRQTARSQPVAPRDPNDPAYDFSQIDTAVREADARGLDILLTIHSAPVWAEGPGRPADQPDEYSGTWRPDPGALTDFAVALATRYSGGFTPPGQPTLPRARYYEAWNEPNLPNFITPQWEGTAPTGADVFRAVLNAVYDGVKSVRQDNIVVSGGLAPYGDPPGERRTRPVAFLRDLLCLEGRKQLQPTSCPDPAKFDVLGVHPINTSGGPGVEAIHPDDASSSDIDRVGRVLRAAERKNTIATAGRHPLWATEFWWESKPQGNAPKPKKHARWIADALYRFWKQGVSVAIMFQVRDDPDLNFLQAGVLYFDAKRKPAFQAFRFPFVLERTSGKRLRVWSKVPDSGKLKVQRRDKGGWRRLTRSSVRAGQIYTTTLRTEQGGRYRAVLGDEKSLVWRQR
ncbi:MAG: hypothetical protein ABW228_03735 [Thermoleophilaceae bacterium]